jgi:hypothetical protein
MRDNGSTSQHQLVEGIFKKNQKLKCFELLKLSIKKMYIENYAIKLLMYDICLRM